MALITFFETFFQAEVVIVSTKANWLKYDLVPHIFIPSIKPFHSFQSIMCSHKISLSLIYLFFQNQQYCSQYQVIFHRANFQRYTIPLVTQLYLWLSLSTIGIFSKGCLMTWSDKSFLYISLHMTPDLLFPKPWYTHSVDQYHPLQQNYISSLDVVVNVFIGVWSDKTAHFFSLHPLFQGESKTSIPHLPTTLP